MRTNAPDIYDYDCAKIGEGNFQLWAKATEQNRVAEPHAPTSDRKINTAQILRL